MQSLSGGLKERARWVGYGLIAGLILGMLIGWMFHSLIGAIVRIGIILIFLIPLGIAIWFFMSNRRNNDRSVTVQETTWRDIGGRRDRS